jgi:hypothetical protein
VVQQRPDLSGSLEQITGLYMEIAYEPQEAVSKGSSPAVVEFRKALGELRSRLGKQAG